MSTTPESVYKAPDTDASNPPPLILKQFTMKDLRSSKNRGVRNEFMNYGEVNFADENIKFVYKVREIEEIINVIHKRTSKSKLEIEKRPKIQKRLLEVYDDFIKNDKISLSHFDKMKFKNENDANQFTLNSFLKVCEETEISLNLTVLPKFLKTRDSTFLDQETDTENELKTVRENIDIEEDNEEEGEKEEVTPRPIQKQAPTIQQYLSQYLNNNSKDKTYTPCCCFKCCVVDKKAVYENLQGLSQSITDALQNNPNDVDAFLLTLKCALQEHDKLIGSGSDKDPTHIYLASVIKTFSEAITPKTTVRLRG